MGVARQQLVFLALCVLDEATDLANHGAVPPSPGLRLALAFLYDIGDRREEWFDREPYDEFWRAATGSDLHGATAEAFGRSQQLTSTFNAIARAAGMERDYLLIEAMRKARGG